VYLQSRNKMLSWDWLMHIEQKRRYMLSANFSALLFHVRWNNVVLDQFGAYN